MEEALPVPVSPGGGEALDLAADLGAVLHHLALDVELEGLLSKVGVHDLARSLQFGRGAVRKASEKPSSFEFRT